MHKSELTTYYWLICVEQREQRQEDHLQEIPGEITGSDYPVSDCVSNNCGWLMITNHHEENLTF